jgi:SPP1 family predicted phage head-tail adaptor
MDIGKLDRYVRIEQKSVTNDPNYGSEVITWTTYKECWAQVLDVTGRNQESTKSDLRLLKRPCEVMLRYDSGIDATMRIIMLDRDERVLQIVTKPAEIGRREGLKFMCEDYSE